MKQIQDYLQTQALTLSPDDVAVARATTQAVIHNAQAHIDHSILLHDGLPALFSAHIDTLKQLFIALDSTYSRQNTPQTAVLYAWLPAQNELVRVAQIGTPIENRIRVNDDTAWQYLAVRTAHSGWANIADNVAKWLQIGELKGEHNRRAASQISLPVCGEDGVVYGVLHLEIQAALPESVLADWVGFVLGVLPTLRELFPQNQENDDEN